jgi:Fe2+ transport system protein B
VNEAVIHVHRGGPLVALVALVGNPNCGKTALFNLLTGSRQKVANYAGVTVERKEGKLITPAGKTLRVLDLPGAYSLHARSPDERVTCDVLYGRARGEKRPDLVVCVVDATNLRRNLRMVLAVKRLGLPCVGALLVAWVLEQFTARGQVRSLMMELPAYHWPTVRNVAIGLWQRVEIFMRRVDGIILGLTIALWFLASFPAPPAGATGAPIEYSIAGTLGRALAVVFEPIGFNWQISIALVPGLAAREVAVGALGTVYALSATGEDTAQALTPLISHTWSLATALSLLAWYVFAPQCLSTLATVKRETGGWAMPLLMAGYLFALAYAASFITYRVALAWGGG